MNTIEERSENDLSFFRHITARCDFPASKKKHIVSHVRRTQLLKLSANAPWCRMLHPVYDNRVHQQSLDRVAWESTACGAG